MALEHTGADQALSSDVISVKAVTDNLPNSGALTDISDVTGNLPNSGALTDISTETDKIDSAATDGLTGTEDSLAYRIHEAERHLHSYERWFGLATAPNGEIHRADSINDGTAVAPFVPDAGNDTWGSWVQILGSSDTPVLSGSACFDLHRIQVVAVESANATHFVQIAFGSSGAAALTAGTYTEFVFHPQSVQGAETILDVQTRRILAGVKGWVRLLARGQNTSTMSFYFGLHEYEG